MASSRFQIIENNQLLPPGNCVSCGGGPSIDNRRFIDLGFSLEFFGALYICTMCMCAVAADVGYVPESEGQGLVQELIDTKEKLNGVLAENEALRYAMASVLNLPLNPPVGIDALVRRIVSDVQVSIAHAKSTGGAASTDQGSNASGGSKGSRGVRTDAANPFGKSNEGTGTEDHN